MTIKIEFDENETEKRIKERMYKVQPRFDNLVMRDSNFYCPKDTNKLHDSAIISSTLGNGYIEWTATYAKAQYYGYPNKSKHRNPNATGKWFETAKANKIKAWEKCANDWYRAAR